MNEIFYAARKFFIDSTYNIALICHMTTVWIDDLVICYWIGYRCDASSISQNFSIDKFANDSFNAMTLSSFRYFFQDSFIIAE